LLALLEPANADFQKQTTISKFNTNQPTWF